jgi:hypothetical protein
MTRSCRSVGMWAVAGLIAAAMVHVPPAAADTVTMQYRTPGTYSVSIPQYTTSVNIVAEGASGTAGGASGGGGSSGGAGGLGSQLNATIPVAPNTFIFPGQVLQVSVGAQGGGGAGGGGNENAGNGGSGGGDVTVSASGGIVLAVAGGGGGGGGAGGAFVGQDGGAGGQGSGTNDNGVPGSGNGGGQGGATGQYASCATFGSGGAGGSANGGTDAGGGGGGGDGFCAANSGAAGGVGGGGGGGGGSGGTAFWAQGSGSIGIAPFTGDGAVTLMFTRTNVAPQITSGASTAVASSAGAVNFGVTATGFPAPTFSISGAPSWLSINPSSGVLSGTIPPRTLGWFRFTITASNGVSPNATQSFTLSISGPPLRLTAPGALAGNLTNPFSKQLVATGGVAPYSWSVASGTLPAGLSLSSAGVLSGTPTALGTSTFTIKASDSALPTPKAATEALTMTIAPRKLTISTVSLAAGTVGLSYSQTLRSAMGTAPLTWSITSGTLPAGLTLRPGTGTISGTPTTAGSASLTIKVTDSTSPTPMTATTRLSLAVHPNIQAAVFATNGANSAVHSFALGASGNATPLSSITGSATGLLGTTAVAIDPNGRVYVASYANNKIAEFAYGTNGNIAPSSVIIGANTGLSYPEALAIAGSGKLYVADYNTQTITVYAAGASGNATPVATITGSSTGLSGPIALTFDSVGHLWVVNYGNTSLTEYAAGANGNVKPLATISGGATGLNGPEGMTFDAAGKLLVANTNGESLTEYSPTARGNVIPLRTISGPATGLSSPVGIDVDAAGDIYVSNQNAGITKYSPNATGDAAPVAAITGSSTGLLAPTGLAVAPPLSVRTVKLRAARVGQRYSVTFRANLGTTPYRWSVRKGKLPRGLRLSHKGRLSGRAKRRGVYRFTVQVRDHTRPSMTATQRFTLRVRRQHLSPCGRTRRKGRSRC